MMDERQVFDQALEALLTNPATVKFRYLLLGTKEEFAVTPTPLQDLAQKGGITERLVRLQLGGYLDPANHAPRPVLEHRANDYGPYRPDPREQARLSQIPSIAELIDIIEAVGPGAQEGNES